jgi:alpha-glucoside transport system permease protein
MTAASDAVVPEAAGGPVIPTRGKKIENLEVRADKVSKTLSSRVASLIAILIAVFWTIPTLGLLVTSFRPEADIVKTGWWTWFTNPTFTLDNYTEVLTGSRFQLSTFFVNSFVITLPSVVIPITLALLAAYAFAWIDFKGRSVLFIAVFALQVVPIQVTLIPLLTTYVNWGINGTFLTVWLSHSMFALPLAIFQFLWVWNDLLVALVFAGGSQDVAPLTVRVAELSGTRGQAWYLLSAGAFVSMVVPVIVFLALQRYFVRGLLAGSVKG